MRIRSITVFDGTTSKPSRLAAARAGTVARDARTRLQSAGFEVQTTRLALNGVAADCKLPVLAAEWEKIAKESGIDYVSLGPVASEHLEVLPEVLAVTTSVFASAIVAQAGGVVDFEICARAAKVIRALAHKTENGFGNLRFAALANCRPGIPFFPAAYAETGGQSFALAIETAKLALDAALAGEDVDDAGRLLTGSIVAQNGRIVEALEGLGDFAGCDWSLAPHPDKDCSIGAAIEKLSGVKFGEWGTLTAVRTLTKAIRAARVKHVGFSGVFLPLLEDAVLAERCTPELDVQHLLLYSAVCGAGLDTIPLAGDVDEATMASVIGDVATLSMTLNKPLTVRLMPVPELKVGELTKFENPYLINARLLGLGGTTAH